jgi:RimJ/RimL family protein N-acetyltransferase
MTTDVLLREVEPADLPVFFEHQREPAANLMAAFAPRERDAFMAHWAKIAADPKCVTQTIVFGGQVAGNVCSWEQDGERQVGYWIGREYWGRGIASGALAAFLYLLRTRPLHAHVAKHNPASLRVLQKCGFELIGETKVSDNRFDGEVEEFILKLN